MEITFTREQAQWFCAGLAEAEKKQCFYTPNQDDHPELGIEKPGTLEVPDVIADRDHVRISQAREMSAADLNKPVLLNHAKHARWTFENGGTNVAGMRVSTDDRTIARALLMVQSAGEGFETDWHAMDGSTHHLDANGMRAVASAITQHIARSFSIFTGVKADIEAGRITTIADIDAAFRE
jgi:hypothetical protein